MATKRKRKFCILVSYKLINLFNIQHMQEKEMENKKNGRSTKTRNKNRQRKNI